jgi:hypothetical protein
VVCAVADDSGLAPPPWRCGCRGGITGLKPGFLLTPASVRCSTHGKFISGDTEFTLKRLEILFLPMLATERATLACPKEAI